MRRALAAGCFASASAWALLTLAQNAAPPAAATPASPPAAAPPAGSPPAPAPAAPVPEAPAPEAPAPGSTGPVAPASPGPDPAPSAPEQPAGAAPGATPQPPPAEPAPPPSETLPPAPASPPAAADRQLEGADTAAPAAAKDERAPVAAPKSDPWQDGHALALELSLRVSGRLNAAASSANYEERAGVGLDGALWFTLSSQYALGLGVKRSDLGNITHSAGVNTIDAGYASTALALGLRAFPFRSEDWDIFLGLRAGLAWQDVSANGLQQVGAMPDSAVPFECYGVDGPGFAMGAEIGVAFRLSPYLWLNGTVDANGYRLSNDLVDECIPGIGSITTVSGGLGLLYAFDLGREAKL